MNYINKKSYFLIFNFLYMHIIAQNAEVRLAAGPAWYEFYSITNFEPISALGKLDQESIRTDLNIMPYVRASFAATSCWQSFIQCVIETGSFKKGNFLVNQSLASTPVNLGLANIGWLQARCTTVQLIAGLEAQLRTTPLYAKPQLGYVLNTQRLHFDIFDTPQDLHMASRWQGLLLGLEGIFKPYPCWDLHAAYKGIIGDVNLSYDRDMITLLGSDIIRNYGGRIPAYGNIIALEFDYCYSSTWLIGCMVEYMNWRIHKETVVPFRKNPSTASRKVQVAQLFWERIFALFFVEATF